ncbi:MAG: sulfite exporter TauE/SafE family protein [Planctomycetes bacterium]|nr:sulfite exporter TauE/SafE family protein [Planctomycetota bacterium]
MAIDSIIIIVAALAVGSFVRGITGIGLPLIAIPVMAGFIGVQNAVVIMVVPNVFLNGWLLWTYRAHRVALPNFPAVVIAAFAGVVFGSWVLSTVAERVLIFVMVGCLGLYLLKLAFRIELGLPQSVGRYVGTVVVFFAGLVQGATGFSGPVVAPWAHSLRLPPQGYVFVVSILFMIFAAMQILAYGWFGTLTVERLYMGALACVPVAVVLPLAIFVARRIGQREFNAIIVAVLVVVEIRLIFKALG